MKIVIETIHHLDQRYTTVGDWYQDADGTLHIKVSTLANWKREALVAIHELVEALLCKSDHISQERVDAFDLDYEKARPLDDDSEPGDCPTAPYTHQHCAATGIERMMASLLGVHWKDYEEEINSLPEAVPKK